MSAVDSIQNATGLSWGGVMMGSLFVAFILYAASNGSLAKYKAWLL
jgi:hypothetical protein